MGLIMTKEIKGTCLECGGKLYDTPYEGYEIPMFFKCEECEAVFYEDEEDKGNFSVLTKEEGDFFENVHNMTFCLVGDEEEDTYYDRLPSYKLRELIPVEKCARCGEDEPLDLDVHHRNGIGWDNRPENLIVLCSKCHRTVGKKWFLDEIGETVPIYEGKNPQKRKPRKIGEFIAENKRLERKIEDSVYAVINSI
jgi:hypothetical protein